MWQTMKWRSLCSALLVMLGLTIVLSACGGGDHTSPAPSGSITVTVMETDYKIDSSIKTFKAGQLYHFVVANNGGLTHEFMIMPKTGSSMHMHDAHDEALVMLENIAPGEIK